MLHEHLSWITSVCRKGEARNLVDIVQQIGNARDLVIECHGDTLRMVILLASLPRARRKSRKIFLILFRASVFPTFGRGLAGELNSALWRQFVPARRSTFATEGLGALALAESSMSKGGHSKVRRYPSTT
jgi:hypothetical protein